MSHLLDILEAILFTRAVLVDISFLSRKLKIGEEELNSLVERLNERYKKAGSILRVRRIGNGYQMIVDVDFTKKVKEYLQDEKRRLTRAQLETLAIIAYKQPISVAEIEEIRGSFSRSYVSQLVKMGLVAPRGKSEDIPGKPMLYGTTDKFLEYMGINSLEELPDIEDFHF
jgi:segregation and condensation protein B